MGPNLKILGLEIWCAVTPDLRRVPLDSIWPPGSCRPCLLWRDFCCISINFAEVSTDQNEVTKVKKAEVSFFLRPTVLHDHAASRLILNTRGWPPVYARAFKTVRSGLIGSCQSNNEIKAIWLLHLWFTPGIRESLNPDWPLAPSLVSFGSICLKVNCLFSFQKVYLVS